jgi:tetratricopeptide (TPR) repeat protein
MLLRLLTTEVIEIQTSNPQDSVLIQGVAELQILLKSIYNEPPQVVISQSMALRSPYVPDPWKKALDKKLDEEKTKSIEFQHFQSAIRRIQNEREYMMRRASHYTDLQEKHMIAYRNYSDELPLCPTFLSATEYIHQIEQLKTSLQPGDLTEEQIDQYLVQHYYSIGCVYRERDQPADALMLYQKGYSICMKYVESSLWSLAKCMLMKEIALYLSTSEALLYFAMIKQTLERMYHADCFAIATTQVKWATLIFEQYPTIQNSIELTENTYASLKKSLDPNSPEMAMNISILVTAFLKLNHANPKILDYLLQAYRIYESQKEELIQANTCMLWADILKKIGNYYIKTNEPLNALKYYFEGWDYCNKLQNNNIPGAQYELITLGNNIATVYSFQNDHSRALDYYQRVHDAMIGSQYPSNHPNLVDLLCNMAVCYFRRGEPGDHNQTVRLYEQVLSKIEDPLNKAKILSFYAVALYDLLKYEASKQHFEQALDILEKQLPAGHSDIVMARKRIQKVSGKIDAEQKALVWLFFTAYPIYMPKIIKAAAEVMIETVSPWRPSRPTLFRQHQPYFEQQPQRNSQQRL